jgi:uncharacterized SAM-binding protein YcdF (DUF218 family)
MRVLPWLGAATLLTAAGGVFTPLAEQVVAWMGSPSHLQAADAIVVLGIGGVGPPGVLTQASIHRTFYGIALYQRGLAPTLVLSGAPEQDGPSEAEIRARLALELGVPASAIETESRAHTTRDEALHLGERLRRRGINHILLVADPVDMPRARGAFIRVGFTVSPAPTESDSGLGPEDRLGLMRRILAELVAWSYYRLAGYS